MATETLRPNAAGDSTQFSAFPGTGEANWEDVAEAVADEDATYVYKDDHAAGIDLYIIAAPTFPSDAKIKSVTLHSRCKYVTAFEKFKGYYGIKSGATESWSAETAFGAGYANYNTVFNTDPNTGLAWTKAAITALQIGVKTEAHAESGMRCTQTYVEVDYTPLSKGKIADKLLQAGAI